MTAGAVGVDVGGTKVLGVAVDSEGTVLSECRLSTPSGGEELLDAIAEAAIQAWAGLGSDVPVGVGVGVPGLIGRDGVLRFAPNIPGVVGLDVRGGLQRRLGGLLSGGPATVVVDNDANCAGVAEQVFGAARGGSEVLFVTIGTGIGGAILTGGALLRGANNFAGEIGHMTIDPAGPECVCGKRGCWERYASGSALGRMARDAALRGDAPGLIELAGGHPEDVRGEHVVAAAKAGDAEADMIFEQYSSWLAIGLANLTALLDPEVIVLGGGLVVAGEVLLEPARRAFEGRLEGAEYRVPTPIVAAQLGEVAGAIGGAALALGASVA